MLSSLSTREVSTIGVVQQNTFSIKGTGKAFKILINGLYSDKILAVVREICTNAYDSHITAGHPARPFGVHLPNTFEPWFSVRDFGVSMTHEQIMHMYTTVFESTKDKSNEQVGQLGLGSKSPFAYTDTFTLTAWLDGEKRVYSAFLGSDSVPQIALIGTLPEEEPNGIEVQFPVDPKDFDTFGDRMRRVARGFDVKPIVTGQDIKLDPPEVVAAGINWTWYNTGGRATARQGCVIYPIDANAFDNLSSAKRAVLLSPIQFDFPIGDLEITPSRETLGYDQRTIDNITAQIDVVLAELVADVTKRIESAENRWQAYILFDKVMSSGIDNSFRDYLRANVTWRDMKLHASLDTYDALDAAGGKVSACYVSNYTINRYKKFKWEPSSSDRITPNGTMIVVDDTTKFTSMVPERIKMYRTKNGIHSDLLWVKANPNSYAFKRFLVKLGRPPFILADTLDKPPRDSVHYAKKPVPMRVLSGSSFVETTIQVEDGGIYVDLKRGEPLDKDGNETSASSVTDVRNLLVRLGAMAPSDKIVGIPATHKRITKADGWVNFWEIALRFCVANLPNMHVLGEADRARRWMHAHDEFYTMFAEAAENNLFPIGGEALKFVTTIGVVQAVIAEGEKEADRLKLCTRLDIKIDGVPSATNYPTYDLKKTYPMIAHVPVPSYDSFKAEVLKDVIDYVNMIDFSANSATIGEAA